jgi:hypothetical protein
MDEAEQDVLSPDEVVVEQARLLLGQYEDMSGSVSKALKHRSSQDRALRVISTGPFSRGFRGATKRQPRRLGGSSL